MADAQTIEQFINNNSSLINSPEYTTRKYITIDTKYRPDKIFERDDYMKWDMILNNIDTPHKLVPGVEVASISRVWLTTELNALKTFHI